MNPAIRWAGAGVLVLAVVGAAVLLMRPASSVGPARPSATPSLTADGSPPATPLATPVPTLTVSDVGRSLRAGSYMVSGFAVPFTVALPDGWAVNELTPTSVAIGSSSDGTINFFMTVVTRAYADPCRPTGSPKPVAGGVDPLVGALSSMKGFTVAGIETATVGGATGKTFTFGNQIDAAATGCTANPMPFVTRAHGATDFDITIFPGETDQFWALDVGSTTVLAAITGNKVDFVRPVFETITFGG